MILEELAARFSFSVEGIEKIRRAIMLFQRLQKAILAVAAAIATRLGRVAGIIGRVSALAVGFGTAFVASSAAITAAAGAITVALGGVAAAFARARKATIDSAFASGVPAQQLALVQNLMTRIGADAKEGSKWVGEFAKKVREGAAEGGDWADALAKQGVRLKVGRKEVKQYGEVIDDIIKAADKIKDPEKKRAFLTEGLEGAPDELIAQLLQATSAFEKWKKLVAETRKAGGRMPLGDILNAGDINDGLSKLQLVVKGFVDAFGSGLMNSFAKDFRDLGNAIMSVATDANRLRVTEFAEGLASVTKSITAGGATVLSAVGSALASIASALGRLDEAAGGRLSQVAIGLAALLGAVTLAAASPIIAVSAAITGLLYGLGEFSKWSAGENSPLKDFFDTIARAAERAQQAVSALLGVLRGIPGLSSTMPVGGNPESPQAVRRDTIYDGIQRLEQLRQKRGELSPERQSQKMATDRAVATGSTTTVSAPVTATATATFNGIFDATAAHRIQAMIDASIRESAAKFATSMTKASNAQTGGALQP